MNQKFDVLLFAVYGDENVLPETNPNTTNSDLPNPNSIEDDLPEDVKEDFKDIKLTPEIQKKVNHVLKKEKEKHRRQAEKTLQQLQQLQKNKDLTEEERKALAEQVESLRKQVFTKEQLAQEERIKLQNKHKEEVSNLTKDRDKWQTLYTNSVLERAIIDAAKEHEAVDSDQILAIVRPNTSLEVDPESKELVPRVKFKDKDAEGNEVTLSLNVSEAVKRMKEKDKYWNLFKTTAKGGIGGSNNFGASLGNLDAEKLGKMIRENPEWYEKNRETLLKLLG